MYDMSETQLVLKDKEIINFLDFFEKLLLEFFSCFLYVSIHHAYYRGRKKLRLLDE